MLKILSEHLRLIMIGLVSILMILAIAILLSLYFGGEVSRDLVISDIQGSASITRESKIVTATKNAHLKSGDIIDTDENSYVRISFDDDKYILVEPCSSVYIYFTDIASKGDIAVNLNKGAVVCQINNKLKKNASYKVKTPNSCINVTGTVFRTSFDYVSEYMGYRNVMITQIQNFEGSVNLQLYDINQNPQDLPMILTERTSAQMLTAENLCQYGYLNYSFDLCSMSSMVLGELIRAQKSRELAFSADEITAAYKIVSAEEKNMETMTTTIGTSETTAETTTVTTTKATEAETTTVPIDIETEDSTSHDTLPTTHEIHEYTTYSGIKWWEITGIANTGTDDYEDWFAEEDEDMPETVPPDTPDE